MGAITIIAATGNVHKLEEFQQILSGGSYPVRVVSAKAMGAGDLPEETGDTFRANARLKAQAIYDALREKMTGRFVVMADDSGLAVDALQGAPGIYSARYALLSPEGLPTQEGDATDEQNVAKLLREMEGVPEGKRQAAFVCAIAALTEDGKWLETEGVLSGEIARMPSGTNGFGYDPVLFVPAYGCTVAELDASAKNAMSHRGQALRAWTTLLADHYRH